MQDPYVWKAHVMYLYDQVAAFQVDDDLQYVRIQLSGTDFLSLAEVPPAPAALGLQLVQANTLHALDLAHSRARVSHLYR